MDGLIIIAASPCSQPASSPLDCHFTDALSRGSCSEKLPWGFVFITINTDISKLKMAAHGWIRWQHRTETTPASCSSCYTPSTELTIFQGLRSGCITISMTLLSETWWCSCHSWLQEERPITLTMKYLLMSTGGQVMGRPLPLATTLSELGLSSFCS